ncbi:hypothetical protein K0M31_013821 [Melipona bicolor]|uniref:Uncharacterized protein n=1 Tax=Melipona bicolor TaxID=60889 RepID=A0AA40KTJ8_9HYME|nr:hypothetical protein K0M31_013821 [Melipona bicolor]
MAAAVARCRVPNHNAVPPSSLTRPRRSSRERAFGAPEEKPGGRPCRKYQPGRERRGRSNGTTRLLNEEGRSVKVRGTTENRKRGGGTYGSRRPPPSLSLSPPPPPPDPPPTTITITTTTTSTTTTTTTSIAATTTITITPPLPPSPSS